MLHRLVITKLNPTLHENTKSSVFYVFEIGALPAPLYNPHSGVLFEKSVYEPRVIQR